MVCHSAGEARSPSELVPIVTSVPSATPLSSAVSAKKVCDAGVGVVSRPPFDEIGAE